MISENRCKSELQQHLEIGNQIETEILARTRRSIHFSRNNSRGHHQNLCHSQAQFRLSTFHTIDIPPWSSSGLMLEVNDASIFLLSSFNIGDTKSYDGEYWILGHESIQFVRFLESCLPNSARTKKQRLISLKQWKICPLPLPFLVFHKNNFDTKRTDVDRSIKKNCSPPYPKIVCIVCAGTNHNMTKFFTLSLFCDAGLRLTCLVFVGFGPRYLTSWKGRRRKNTLRTTNK